VGNIGASISRNRQQSRTLDQYNPDLEMSQQAYANSMYGSGAPTGSVGYSGGQPINQASQGWGTNQFGTGPQNPNPNISAGNI